MNQQQIPITIKKYLTMLF